MAKRYVTKTLTRGVLAEMTCDLCGAKSDGASWPTPSGWHKEETEVRIVVSRRHGEVYPECGTVYELDVDICSNCFVSKLILWLKEQGAEMNEEEHWW